MRPSSLPALAALISVVALSQSALAQVMLSNGIQRFDTIQAAIDAAQPGQVIEIPSGTYRERLVIRSPLTLIGRDTGAGRPVIDGTTAEPRTMSTRNQRPITPTLALEVLRGGAIVVEADDVRIEGIAVTTGTEPHGGIDYFAAVAEEGCIVLAGKSAMVRDVIAERCEKGIVIVGGSDNSVIGSIIRNNAIDGILLSNSRGSHLIDNMIEGNAVTGISIATVQLPQYVQGTERPVAEDNEITRNRVRRNGVGGIGIGLSHRNMISDNEIEGNGTAPVRSDQIAIAGQRGFGIALTAEATENRLESNRILRNEDNGILILSAERNEFVSNEVMGSAFGIQSFAAVGNTFRDNRVHGNTKYGIIFAAARPNEWPSADNDLVGNDVVDNGVNAFDATGEPVAAPSQVRRLPIARDQILRYSRVNRWDDGTRGNHYSDFDKPADGFADQDSDGVGEVARAIPGGKAVDRFPLASVARTSESPPQAPTVAPAQIRAVIPRPRP